MSRRTARQAAPGRKLSRSQTRGASLIGACALAAAAIPLGVVAAWPIYQSERLWLVATVAALTSLLLVLAGRKWRWGGLTLAALAAAFVLLVVPVATPQVLDAAAASGGWGLVRGVVDAVAAVALGWKQLLTLTLPVGSYQTVLVPFFALMLAVVAAATALARGGARAAVYAALPLLALVLFGTVFGASVVSPSLTLGVVEITAPRETGLWVLAFGGAAAWMTWTAGRERRAALRRGRVPRAQRALQDTGRGPIRRNALVRGGAAVAVVALAATIGVIAAPALAGSARAVPRDSIDPEVVVRDQVSPLAEYRAFKRDGALDEELFQISGGDRLPGRLRVAVLDGYDGVDFFVGEPGTSGRFTRFPSGSSTHDPIEVTVRIGAAYAGVWVPLAAYLAEPPQFGGPRAAKLADSFYVNRETGAAVAVPTAAGLAPGDEITAVVSGDPDLLLRSQPASEQPLVDPEDLPQLMRWLDAQGVSASPIGLMTAIDRLRARGYLSHSLTDGEGERAWLTELGDDSPDRFVSSPGGHSTARIEQLFTQLNEQAEAAGEQASDDELVAAAGDDEQFAAAAALLARALGYDSRVVLGVRTNAAREEVPGVPACADVCSGKHVAAWIEVRGADGAWAPFDTSPQLAVPPQLVQKGEQLPKFPTVPEERDATESDPPVGTSNDDSAADDQADDPQAAGIWPVLRLAGLALSALALLALLLAFIPAVKRIRRRARKRQRTPELRAVGAWHELLDTYTDSGVHVPARQSRARTVQAIADSGAEIEHGEWIAATVDQAVYAHEGVSPETSDHLWSVVDAQIRARRAQIGPWARLRTRYWLRSFVTADPRDTRLLARARTRGGRS